MAHLFNTVVAVTALISPALAATRSYTPVARQASSGNVVSSNVLTLKKSTNAARSAQYLRSTRNVVANSSYAYEHTDNLLSDEYIAEIEWAGVPVEVIIDTGSSDTWLVQAGFTCVDEDGNVQEEADCYFGPTFNGTFDEGSIADENFNIEYGDGEFLTGVFGYENVTVAGITVDHQQVALVNYSYWFGDSVTSGLMGLAYPLLTSAYEGSDPDADSLETQVEYNSIITTMINESLIDPVFSLALERNSDGGYLAFGGLPPVNYTGSFATTPILMIEVYDEPEMATQYSFYTIIADAYIYEGSSNQTDALAESWSEAYAPETVNTTQFPIIVDSGTTLLYLPTELYDDIAALYDPAVVYIDDQGASFAPCDASVPYLGVQINGTVFDISEADMLMQEYTVELSGTEYCLIGPQDGGSEGPYILGDTFLNNVIAVFDVGASEIRFAEHVY
ncbi:acid protease [Cryphonectria parasitica EP155]|uniref:Acid protease n=1 Tax=Cryphonectria parasitica (strain ATCC 38755 / EP155) TaxID=660469 RepID=A0A9P5CM71_CRYP1|nr:acid protease [Cryphonectria parasitica EP155]KAF3763818.1 acid protease [Cryphonectria parasitica EP155]